MTNNFDVLNSENYPSGAVGQNKIRKYLRGSLSGEEKEFLKINNMILKSRKNYISSEDFRDKFLDTITPGVIKREDLFNGIQSLKKQRNIRNFLISFDK